MDPVTLAVLGTIAVVTMLAKGTASYFNKRAERDATVQQLNQENAQLQLQMQSNQDSYNNNMSSLDASLSSAKRSASSAILQTAQQRTDNANVAANVNVENQSLMYRELAETQKQGIQAVGSVNQANAVSGFRNTAGTSTAERVQQTEKAASNAYDTEMRQIKLSSYQSYNSAVSDYESASYQIENYQQNLRDAYSDYALQSRSLTDSYISNAFSLESSFNFNEGQIKDLEAANKDAWQGFIDFFTW